MPDTLIHPLILLFNFDYFYLVRVCCWGLCVPWYIPQGSEGDLQEFFLSFHHVGAEIKLGLAGVAVVTPLSPLTNLSYLLLFS